MSPGLVHHGSRGVFQSFNRAFEFVAQFEPAGWKVAEKLTPLAYVVWSLWLILAGIALL